MDILFNPIHTDEKFIFLIFRRLYSFGNENR